MLCLIIETEQLKCEYYMLALWYTQHTYKYLCPPFSMFTVMIMSTGTNIIHIFIKITHVIRLTHTHTRSFAHMHTHTHRRNGKWMFLMKTLCHFNSIRFNSDDTYAYTLSHFRIHLFLVVFSYAVLSLHKFVSSFCVESEWFYSRYKQQH